MGRRPRRSEMRRTRMAHMTGGGMAAHLGRVHQALVGVVGGSMVMRQRVVRRVGMVLVGRLMETLRSRMVERTAVVVM